MAQRSKQIQADIIEYECDECLKGLYRVHLENKNSTTRQWLHRCTQCGHEVYFTVIYPIIQYREKAFMLADHLRISGMEPPSIWVGRD